MHTTIVETEEVGEVVVQHNGDWSGMATLTWQNADDGPRHEVRVPAYVLAACAREKAVRDAIHALEEML